MSFSYCWGGQYGVDMFCVCIVGMYGFDQIFNGFNIR